MPKKDENNAIMIMYKCREKKKTNSPILSEAQVKSLKYENYMFN